MYTAFCTAKLDAETMSQNDIDAAFDALEDEEVPEVAAEVRAFVLEQQLHLNDHTCLAGLCCCERRQNAS